MQLRRTLLNTRSINVRIKSQSHKRNTYTPVYQYVTCVQR